MTPEIQKRINEASRKLLAAKPLSKKLEKKLDALYIRSTKRIDP